MPFGHLYVFFGKMFIQIFYPFFNFFWLLFICFYGLTHSTWKFPGQGLNLSTFATYAIAVAMLDAFFFLNLFFKNFFVGV